MMVYYVIIINDIGEHFKDMGKMLKIYYSIKRDTKVQMKFDIKYIVLRLKGNVLKC